jgi:hypothetical protein
MAPLSCGHSSHNRNPVVLHDCGKKVRLEADGWGYCRECRVEFDGAKSWHVPDGSN